MCIEIISVVLGGVMQKDVVIKCASIATSGIVLCSICKYFEFFVIQ